MMQVHRTDAVQRGLTLVELLTILAVAGVLLTLAVPGFRDFLLQRRLQGAVHEYLSQWHWARMQAVVRNQPVYLSFGQTPTGTCYLFYVGQRNACDCTASTNICQSTGMPLANAQLASEQQVAVGSTQSSTITLDPARGTVTPTFTAVFSSPNGQAVRAFASITGRTRTCGVNTASANLPACS